MDYDDELIWRMGQGDEESFGIFYLRHERQLAGYLGELVRRAVHVTYDESKRGAISARLSPEDLTHDVFVRVWVSAHSYRPEGKARAWLYTVGRNWFKEELKKVLKGEGFISFPEPDPPGDVLMQEIIHYRRIAFRELPEDCKRQLSEWWNRNRTGRPPKRCRELWDDIYRRLYEQHEGGS